MTIKELYILPVRFTADELRKVEIYLCEHRHNLFNVVHEISFKTEVILTKLVQRTRLERELRSLSLPRNVLILQCSARWLDQPYSVATSATYQFWGVYAPRSAIASEARRLPEQSASPAIGLEHSQPSSGVRQVASEKDGKDRAQGEYLESTNMGQDRPLSVARPVLLRHESTADPSSVYHKTEPSTKGASHNKKYACQRWAPLYCENETLVSQFQLMKLARTLQGDPIGERAYSTAIASIRSLGKVVDSDTHVEGLEGCGRKIIEMTTEWLNTGQILEVETTWDQNDLKILLVFWNCHGVGAFTARDWYYNKGYRDLNDVIQDWDNLSRPIQIGLKHYEDFLIPIPREEVAYIGKLVVEAARTVLRNSRASSSVAYEICGGYRRGKEASGDVDIVLTHETCFDYDNMLEPLINELEEQNIVRTVISSHHERDITKQSNSGISIALVVIIPPHPFSKVHRRLDIIVSPPRSYITAITGWSGSTILERDLRRYASEVKGWTFDSTGISELTNKRRIEHESFMWTAGADIIELEKNLFDFLGLEWIPPKFRNAG